MGYDGAAAGSVRGSGQDGGGVAVHSRLLGARTNAEEAEGAEEISRREPRGAEIAEALLRKLIHYPLDAFPHRRGSEIQ
jgi:hypothetical protein